MEIIKIVVPVITGLFLVMVGLGRLFNPIKNYSKNSGIELNTDVNLLNEVRGVSTLMLIAGILISVGAFIPQLKLSSYLIASLIYLGFAAGRIISIKSDGKPNQLIMKGIIFELIFGISNLICLIIEF